ncbi:MAG: hypothetical protein Q9166_004757 [cf. Caloplaca sp. 2 TL-2023]
MANLTIDPHYSDSYSECSSSNSSFSYELLTPTSSAGYSAATSRRQSIASEVQSCYEGAFDRVPSFSMEGTTTPLKTPPPFRSNFRSEGLPSGLQGYEADTSPIGVQHGRNGEISSYSSGPLLQNADPFASQGPYFCATGFSGLDGDIQEECQQDEGVSMGLRSTNKLRMDWSTPFGYAFPPSFVQSDSEQATEGFDYVSSGKLDPGIIGNIHHGLSSSWYLDFGFVNDSSAETELPQTIAPQETIVSSNTSFAPVSPLNHTPEPTFQTPLVKREGGDCGLPTETVVSPLSSLDDGQSSGKGRFDLLKDEDLDDAVIYLPSRSPSRGQKRRRGSNVKRSWEGAHGSVQVISSSDKQHMCYECNMPFHRPEHWKRHKASEAHNNRRREMGMLPEDDYIDEKPYKCKVPDCIAKSIGVTRSDNLKPHYQKTHFYEPKKWVDGKWVDVRKRNTWVSPEESVELGIDEYDLRTAKGRRCAKLSKHTKAKLEDMDD